MKKQSTSSHRTASTNRRLIMLEQVTNIVKADSVLRDKMDPDKLYPEQSPDTETWAFYDYYSILQLVYLEYMGVKYKQLESMFSAPGDPNRGNRPLAWLTDAEKEVLTEKFPSFFRGRNTPITYISAYIPDLINDVILSRDGDFVDKDSILVFLFNLLRLTKENHERRAEVFA